MFKEIYPTIPWQNLPSYAIRKHTKALNTKMLTPRGHIKYVRYMCNGQEVRAKVVFDYLFVKEVLKDAFGYSLRELTLNLKSLEDALAVLPYLGLFDNCKHIGIARTKLYELAPTIHIISNSIDEIEPLFSDVENTEEVRVYADSMFYDWCHIRE